MTKASDNLFPGIIIRESANDGSDFTNPSADYRRLFLGEDGLLHVKDSAGTVTEPYTGSGSVATDAIFDAKGDLAVGTGANAAAKLTVGANGKVPVSASGEATGIKWDYPPFHGARVYNSGTQTMNGSGTNGGVTIITFDSEEYDPDTMHDTGSNTSRLTIPAGMGGKWHFGWAITGTPTGALTRVRLIQRDSGNTQINFRGAYTGTQVASVLGVWQGAFDLAAAAGDYFELELVNSGAGTFTIGNAATQNLQSAFWCHLIGV